MTIDKFGRHIENYYLTKYVKKNLVAPPMTTSITQPLPLLSSQVKNYIANELKKLYGFLIVYVSCGPKSDPKTNYLNLSTGSNEYVIHLKKCEIVIIRTSKILSDFIFLLNGVPFTLINTVNLKEGDKIAIKAKKPIKDQLKLFIYLKYPIYI